jgi:nucleotide-binding universal stress UspA family protein
MQPIPAAERSERGEVDELRTILVTTDFSGISDEAFDSARISAERFGAQLIAAHLQENTLSGVIEDHLSVDDMKTFVALQRKEAREKLAEVAKEHFPSNLEVELCVEVGVPHTEIARLAERKEADVVVMATHGRKFIFHLLLGSTTEQVIRRSPCPVFVVRGRHS